MNLDDISNQLVGFTIRDLAHISRLSKREPRLSVREFVIQFLERKLASDDAISARLESCTDDQLVEILLPWFQQIRKDFDWDPPDGIEGLAYCQQLLVDLVAEFNDRASAIAGSHQDALSPMRVAAERAMSEWQQIGLFSSTTDILKPLVSASEDYQRQSIRPLASLAQIISVQETSALSAIREALTQDLSSIALAQSRLSEIATQAFSPLDVLAQSSMQSTTRIMDEVLRSIREIAQVQLPDLTASYRDKIASSLSIYEKVAATSHYSLAAQFSLTQIPAEGLGSLIGISEQNRLALESAFSSLSRSYTDYLQSFEASPRELLLFPSVVADAPPRGFYRDARLLESISVERDSYEIEEPPEDIVEELLARVAPDLLPLIRGARQAYASNNPDRMRHTITSFREVLTTLLHRLAPDEEVKRWSTSADHFTRDGTLIRRARLLYICRSINHPPFCDYVQNEVATMLSLIDLVQRGTHHIGPPFTEKQLVALKAAIENMVRQILEIALA